MMPDDLLDKIKASGFMRVVIRPAETPESLTVIAAREMVEKASVSLRGWDYPHVTSRNDEHGGTDYSGEYVQDWCDWYRHVEFWRMYKSGQFLHYKALREDLSKEGNVPDEPVLAVGSFMFTVTEIIEFAHRLRVAGLYKDGATIQVSLGNVRGRRLWVEDPRRLDFMQPMVTSAETLKFEKSYTASELFLGDPKDISLPIIATFLEAFGWTPSPSLISSTQEELYNLKLGRDR
nr:hypothetical protein [Brucella intermedia]